MLYHLLPLLPLVVVLAFPAPDSNAKRSFLPSSAETELEKRNPQFGAVLPLPVLPSAIPLPAFPTAVTLSTATVSVVPIVTPPAVGIVADLPGVDATITLTAGNPFTDIGNETNLTIDIVPHGHKVRRGWSVNSTSEDLDGADGNFTTGVGDTNSTSGLWLGADGNLTTGGGVYLYCTQVIGL